MAGCSAVEFAGVAVEQAASAGAKFQAAVILRDAMLRSWRSTSAPGRLTMREKLLTYTCEPSCIEP
jgi:hypothetical protein